MAIDDVVYSGSNGVRVGAPVVYVTAFDYDFSVTGNAGTAVAISTHQVPEGARVIGGWYEVITTFTSSGDAAEVNLHVVNADDLVTGIAISGAGNPWDVDLTKRRALKGIAATQAAAQFVKIHRDAGGQDLTAGVLFGVVEWIRPEESSTGH